MRVAHYHVSTTQQWRKKPQGTQLSSHGKECSNDSVHYLTSSTFTPIFIHRAIKLSCTSLSMNGPNDGIYFHRNRDYGLPTKQKPDMFENIHNFIALS